MMNEETKASLNKFLKEREERIKNMTLAEARDIVSRIYGHSDMRMESDKALQMLLDCADKALEQPRWISVSERLPMSDEEYHTFLVTDSKGNVALSEFYLSISDKKPYWSGMIDVKAWMPLPEPYKENAE